VENKTGLLDRGKWLVNSVVLLLKQPIMQVSIGLAVLVLLAGTAFVIHRTQIPPPQPFQFPHDKHIKLGIQCLYCHPGALRGPSPGLPTMTKCNGCHQQLNKTTPQLDILTAFIKTGQPYRWVPVAILPDFVYYSHRPHIAAGLNCENCHGEISQMALAKPQKMNMGWCLDCHRTRFKDDPVMLTKLTDCATCHR